MDSTSSPDKSTAYLSQHHSYSAGEQSYTRPSESLIPHDPPSTQLQPNFIRRIGKWGFVALSGGFLLLSGALAFLIFLWSSGSDNYIWRKIILSGWAPRSITLASLAIRWAVGAQASFCASMLAALALHRFQVLLPDAAEVSTIRSLHVGPHSLLLPLFQALRKGKRDALWLLVTMSSLVAIVSQFTSTILLSDVQRVLITSDPYTEVLSYAINSSRDDNIDTWAINYAYWKTKPAFYPTFAEFVGEAYQASGVYDTGVSLRGLIPIKDQNVRSALTNYSGFATVIDARVICVRPTSNLHLEVSTDSFNQWIFVLEQLG